jgi:hypothetical protein
MNESSVAASTSSHDPIVVLKRLEPALAKVDPDKFHPGNLDIAHAASVVLGHLESMEKMRAGIEATFRAFDFAHLDNLRDYATAAKYLVNAEDNARAKVDPAASAALDDGRAFRGKIAAVATMFVTHLVFDAAVVASIEALSHGYDGTSNAIIRYCALFADHRAQVDGKMPLTMDTIEEWRGKAIALGALGASPSSKTPEELRDLRRRAVTLFMNAYQEVRWAIDYVRRHERDSAEFAPALSNNRGSSGGGDSKNEELPEDKKAEEKKANESSGGQAPAEAAKKTEPGAQPLPLPDSPFKRGD